jgi:hypothetical protein
VPAAIDRVIAQHGPRRRAVRIADLMAFDGLYALTRTQGLRRDVRMVVNVLEDLLLRPAKHRRERGQIGVQRPEMHAHFVAARLGDAHKGGDLDVRAALELLDAGTGE